MTKRNGWGAPIKRARFPKCKSCFTYHPSAKCPDSKGYFMLRVRGNEALEKSLNKTFDKDAQK
jgi:hypothetical protein